MAQSIAVHYAEEDDIYIISTSSSTLGNIVLNYAGIPEEERGGNASILLLAAALSCYCGTLRMALLARQIPFYSIKAKAVGLKDDSPNGLRLLHIDLDVSVAVDDAFVSSLEHCAKIIKNCLITSSLTEGISVSHTVRRA